MGDLRRVLTYTLLVVALASASLACAPAQAERAPSADAGEIAHPATNTTAWFPFTLPWDDASPTPIDASDLLRDAPGDDLSTLIDARGFVETDADGHFRFANTGQRARFWGTNLTFSAVFPPSPDYPPVSGEFADAQAAEKLAGRLAKLGFNAVRLHHLDWFSRPSGIWQDYTENTQLMDPVQLGRLDQMIYQLKRHGIYVDLNLHVNRNFTLGDGVTDAPEFEASGVSFNKGATLFDPLMRDLQEQYAAQLLNHVNPYTGLADWFTYVQSPTQATINLSSSAYEGSQALGVAVTQVSGADWHVQLWQGGLSVPADSAQFAAVVAQSRDSQPLVASGQVLLSVFTRVENTGQVWNADETSLDDRWGGPPTLIEPLAATVTLTVDDPAAVSVWALDETGSQKTQLSTTIVGGNQLRFTVDTGAHKTLWYALRRPLAAPSASAAAEGSSVQLSWPAVPGATGYHLYRNTANPDFSPDTPWRTANATTVLETNALGQPGSMTFYVAQSFNGFAQSGYSTHTGEFEFGLTPGGSQTADGLAFLVTQPTLRMVGNA